MNENQIAEAILAGILATFEPGAQIRKAEDMAEEFGDMADCLDAANLNADPKEQQQARFLRGLAAQIMAQAAV